MSSKHPVPVHNFTGVNFVNNSPVNISLTTNFYGHKFAVVLVYSTYIHQPSLNHIAHVQHSLAVYHPPPLPQELRRRLALVEKSSRQQVAGEEGRHRATNRRLQAAKRDLRALQRLMQVGRGNK